MKRRRRQLLPFAPLVSLVSLVSLVGLVGACAGDPKVIRVYDGRIVEGLFVPPEAYALYLKGVLAEEAGDLRSALSAYEQAAREDDEDAEPFTRIGDVRCKLDPKNHGADDAFAQALRIDKTYAPALAAQARCAASRGQTAEAIALADQSVSEDRTNASMESLFVKLAAQRDGATANRARERVIALTLASGEQVAAWDALIAWGRSKSDPELLARGFEGLAHVAPMRGNECEAGALELLGLGQAGLARRVAASIADAPASHNLALRDPTVARLAIDEALLLARDTSNIATIERRATRGHIALSEVAARALILERADLANQIARNVAAADPNAGGAQMVLAAIAAREGKSLPASLRSHGKDAPTDRPSAACVLVLAERITTYANVETARAWVARMSPSPMAPHDPVTGPLAVDLAARGVIVEAGLPLELRLELAARRREPPKPIDESSARAIDAKHMLLWHVLIDPIGAPARSLLGKMQNASDRDPIIGYALARAALASSPKSDAWAPVMRAIASAPAHPLLLAVAVDIAKKAGRAEEIPPARARLMAVARTPAERALAAE